MNERCDRRRETSFHDEYSSEIGDEAGPQFGKPCYNTRHWNYKPHLSIFLAAFTPDDDVESKTGWLRSMGLEEMPEQIDMTPISLELELLLYFRG